MVNKASDYTTVKRIAREDLWEILQKYIKVIIKARREKVKPPY